MSGTAEGINSRYDDPDAYDGQYPPDWDERRRVVYRRDDYVCRNCGAQGGQNGDSELHAHHQTLLSHGGSNALDNLVTLCKSYHNNRHDHDITSDWREVVRYDHDRNALGGHDVTEEGLHRDVYRDGEKYDTEEVSPPIPANEAFDHAEEDLRKNVQRPTKRFEKWHEVKDRSDL